MAAVMIGIDPHKASHTAVAISGSKEPLGTLRIRAGLPRQPGWWSVANIGAINIQHYLSLRQLVLLRSAGISPYSPAMR
jgi:hypothetical protein